MITNSLGSKALTFSGLIFIDGHFGSIEHHIFPLPPLLTTFAISVWANTNAQKFVRKNERKKKKKGRCNWGLRLPRLLHPSLQTYMSTSLFDLKGRRVRLFSTQSLWKVSGILSRQSTGGRKTRRAFRVAQSVTLWNTRKERVTVILRNFLRIMFERTKAQISMSSNRTVIWKQNLNYCYHNN